jgi:K(+)-stimulated pyrophosphate-energized sodium pump
MSVRTTRVWVAGVLTAMAVVMAVAVDAVPSVAGNEAPLAQTQSPPATRGGGEASLVLPDLSSVSFQGIPGHTLLLYGIGISVLGLVFGLVINRQLKALPVHRSMLEIS